MENISLEIVYKLANMSALELTEEEAKKFLEYLVAIEEQSRRLIKENDPELTLHDLIDDTNQYTLRTGTTVSLPCVLEAAPVIIAGLVCSPPVLQNED